MDAPCNVPVKAPIQSKIGWGAKLIIALVAIQDPVTQGLITGLLGDFHVQIPAAMFGRIMGLLGVFIWVCRRWFTETKLEKPNLKDPWS